MAKKPNESVFTPTDLEAWQRKNHRGVRREATQMSDGERRRKRIAIITLIIIIIILLLWLVSYFTTQFGDLVVTLDKDLGGKGIVLSETRDFAEPTFELSGENADGVFHFTYNWFEARGVLDTLDDIDGSHNGDDYFAYTFYIKNNGTQVIDYNARLIVTGVSKGCDEAARIMIYKNGEPTIYAKPQYETDIPEEGTVAFLDEKTVCEVLNEGFAPETTDRYTVVIWFEGNDSECINDIMGGHMRLSMLFEAAEPAE